MENETKSYNPFKMWGSWIGFGLGTISTIQYVSQGSFLPDMPFFILLDKIFEIFQFLNVITILIQWPLLPVIMLTPIFTFLYGWGIHSLFRKFGWKLNGWKLLIEISVVLIIVFFITDSQLHWFQTIERNRPSPETEKLIQTNNSLLNDIFNTVRDQSIAINTRLEAIEIMVGKLASLSSPLKLILADLLTELNSQVYASSQLSDTDKQQMYLRINALKELVKTKKIQTL